MPSATRLILSPMLFASLLAASACGPQVRIQPAFPPAADLQVEPKPVPPAEIVTSAQAAAEYDIAVETWGTRGWLQVARLCRWAQQNGMPDIVCPPA